MSDEENNTGEEAEGGAEASQEDIDSMFDDAPADGDTASKSGDGDSDNNGMNLTEIDDDESLKPEEENPYGIGEPMANDVTAIYEIPVQISAVLGRSSMQVSQLLKLGRGAVVELDRKVGEAIDIYVNNRLVARGEVVVVEDKLGVTMTEIVKSDRS